MDKFASLVLSGAVSGAIYALLAIGVVLSYATSRVFNFGHAATAFASAFIFFQLNTGLGWSTWASLIVSVGVIAPLGGAVWDRLVFRRLAGAGEAATIVASVGVLVVMPALVRWVAEIMSGTFGVGFVDTGSAFSIPGLGPVPPTTWEITDSFVVNSDQVIVLGVGVVCFIALGSLLRFSSLGLQMRAAVDNPTVARLRGIDTSRLSTVAWVLSFTLAGLAGVLAAPFVGPFGLSSDNYTFALFVAATAAVIAGLRSIPIAFGAAVLLGAGRNIAEGYVTGEYLGGFGRWVDGVYGLRSSFPYLALFVALVVIGHERGRRVAGTTSDAAPPPSYLSELPAWRRSVPWVIAGAGLCLYSLVLADAVWLDVVLTGLAMAVVFLSFTVMTGIGGMVSLAQSTFVAIGALTAGMLISDGWPFGPAAVVGIAAAGMVGVVVALPALRLGGLPLTLSSLALALLGSSVIFNLDWFTNGATGWSVDRPTIGPIDLSSDETLFVVLGLIVIAAGWMVANLPRSASGRAMIALRSSPPAAAASGVSPTATKLTVFALSAAFAGLGGVLLATVAGSVRGTTYPAVVGFIWLAVVVTFGVQRPHAAVVAGFAFAAMPRVLSSGIHVGDLGWDGTSSGLIPQLLFGLGAIGLAKEPHGLLVLIAQRRHQRAGTRGRAGDGARPASDPVWLAAGVAADRSTVDPLGDVDGLLVLRGIRARYDGLEVLHGVDLTVAAGQVHAVLGPNGAGKSTLCSIAAGLVPATGGSVIFDGVDVTQLAAHERARRGLLLVPESRGVFAGLTVEENLAMWLDSRSDREGVYALFPNLASRRRVLAGNLSGGEQQMLSLAPFLAREPKLLIADEPTLGLSVQVVDQVNAAFGVLRDKGTTLLLVEEKARDAMELADTVTALSLGVVQWRHASNEVDESKLARAYLGVEGKSAIAT